MKSKRLKSTRGKKNRSNTVGRFMLAFFMAAVFLLTSVPMTVNAGAVTSPDIIVTAYHYTNGPLTQGESFTLTDLTFKNVSGVQLSNVSVDFTSAYQTVTVPGGGTVVIPNTGTTLAIVDEKTLQSVAMKYVGDGTNGRIPVVFTYTKGVTVTETTAYIVFDVTPPSTTPPSEPVDTTKYKPALTATISGNNYTTGGQQNELRILIKNTSISYAARNVMVGLPEVNGSPFTAVSFGAQTPIPLINPGASVELTALVTSDVYTASGAYKLPLHLTYVNAWDNPFESDVSLPVTMNNANTKGFLKMQLGTPVPPVVAGGTFDVPVTVKNTGTLTVTGVRIALDGLSAEGFMLASGTNRTDFDRIEGGAVRTYVLKLKAAVTLKNGSMPLGFKLTYSDAREVPTEDLQQIWMPVGGAGAADNTIEIVSIAASKTAVNPSQSVSVTAVIKNTGTVEVKQVKVSGEAAADAFFAVSQNMYILKTLKPGEEKKLTFTFQAMTEAKRGSQPLTVKVEPPVVGTETPVVMAQAVAVFVAGSETQKPEDASKNVPKIIVSSYAAEPALVSAGSEFDLNLEFMNTHSEKAIYNIKANFTVTEASSETGSVFTPVGSSNTFYIDRISPKASVPKKLRLYTIPDAKSKTYNVNISFDYEDKDGNPYKTDEIIGIPVYQPTRFEISEPNFQTDTMVGQMMPVSFEMVNLGKNLLYNVKMKVMTEPEGMADITPKSQYYGNFDPGHNEYAEVTLNPMMAGTVNGKIIVTYESASGEQQEEIKEFSVNVAEMPPMPDNPGEVLGPDGKPIPIGPDGMPIVDDGANKGFVGKILGSFWGKIGIGVLVALIAFFVIRKMRKKKTEKDLDF